MPALLRLLAPAVAGLLALGAVALDGVTREASEGTDASAPVPGAAPEAAGEFRPTPIAQGGFRLEAAPGTTLTIDGLGRFADTVEVIPAPDGRLQVINELPVDGYLEGLGEMPGAWHEQALQSQAVAARSYAAWTIERGYYPGRGLDFDICGSTACQVFQGRKVVETPVTGARWAAAVAATSGEVLTHEGRPILARFFSSSGGRSRSNQDVFTTTGDLPYLTEVDDPDDALSPLHRWQVRFTRVEMDQILSRGASLGGAVPAVGFETVASDGTRPDDIRIIRADGHAVQIPMSRFRAWVSEMAPKLFPGRFPQRRGDGGRMPATLPSSRMDFAVTPDEIIIDGRGWGHAVGMSQWGARGKAERGLTHDQILAAYYPGATLEAYPGLPARVRVGLRWEANAVTVSASGPVTVMTPNDEAAVAGGSWTFGNGSPSSVRVTSPPDEVTWVARTTPTRRETSGSVGR